MLVEIRFQTKEKILSKKTKTYINKRHFPQPVPRIDGQQTIEKTWMKALNLYKSINKGICNNTSHTTLSI